MKGSTFQRIVGINLAILVALAVLLRLVNRGGEGEIAYMFEMAFLIMFMLLANAGFGLFSETKEQRQAHWLSFLLVLLIGFGLCGAGATIHL